jgi:hypothetical protein
MDRGLISEKPRGLSAKSSRSGPWVDFTRVQGPLCKISEITRITNYFPTVNPVHRGPTVARTEGTAVCSLELSLRPLRCAKAHRRGCKRGSGAWGARLGPHRSSGGTVATAVQNREAVALGERAAQAWREGKRSGERCGETQ